jgi:hypothetical protein
MLHRPGIAGRGAFDTTFGLYGVKMIILSELCVDDYSMGMPGCRVLACSCVFIAAYSKRIING